MHHAQADPLDPLANFIKDLKDLSSMSGLDIAVLVSDLPAPQEGDVEGMSVEDAVRVCQHIEIAYYFIYDIICDCV